MNVNYNRDVSTIDNTEIRRYPLYKILSFISDEMWTKNYDGLDITWFVYNEQLDNYPHKEEVSKHLLKLYPELKNVGYPKIKANPRKSFSINVAEMTKEIKENLGLEYSNLTKLYEVAKNSYYIDSDLGFYYLAVLDYLRINNVPIEIPVDDPWNATLPITRLGKKLPGRFRLNRPKTRVRIPQNHTKEALYEL